jgi:hypothetical protein
MYALQIGVKNNRAAAQTNASKTGPSRSPPRLTHLSQFDSVPMDVAGPLMRAGITSDIISQGTGPQPIEKQKM